MQMFTLGRSALGLLGIVAAGSASAQVIGTEPAPLGTIPVGGPFVSIGIAVVLLAVGAWALRRHGLAGQRLLSACLPLAFGAALVGHSIGPAVAQTIDEIFNDLFPLRQEVFSNPEGEIRSIPLAAQTALAEEVVCLFEDPGSYDGFDECVDEVRNGELGEEFPLGEPVFVGIQDVEYTNVSDGALRISRVDVPSFEQCGNLALGALSEESFLEGAEFFIWYFSALSRLFELVPLTNGAVSTQSTPTFEEVEAEFDELFFTELGTIPGICGVGKNLRPGQSCTVPVSAMCVFKVGIFCDTLGEELPDLFPDLSDSEICTTLLPEEGFGAPPPWFFP